MEETLIDGLSGDAEVFYDTDPNDWDTDGNLFPDGWEVQYGYDGSEPSDPDPNGDVDGDGLNNFYEMTHGTDPGKADTDGDGVSDGAEVTQGSDPADADDQGDPANCMSIELTVGDHSGSHSERYGLLVGHVYHVAPTFGEVATTNYSFVCGKEYAFRVQWIDSNLSSPDYDYTAQIGGLGGSGRGVGFEVDDPQGILGVHGESTYNFAAGKSGTLYVYGVNVDLDEKDAVSGNEVPEESEDTGGALVLDETQTPAAQLIVRSCGESGLTRKLSFSDYTKVKVDGSPVAGEITVPTASDQEHIYNITQNGTWDPTNVVIATLTVENGGSPIHSDSVKLVAIRPRLVPNYDRDGDIDTDDEIRADAQEVFCFWINDDDDFDVDEGTDTPGQPETGTPQADYAGAFVDSERDLVDFFAVFVDVKDTLNVLPATEYDYILKHSTMAFSALINPGLMPSQADYHLFDKTFCLANKEAELQWIGSSGYTLSTAFLDEIRNNNKGIILLEGRKTTQESLVLEIKKKSDGVVVFTKEMPVSIDGVEKMYRHINLRPDLTGLATSTSEPSNYPDSLCSDKNLFFLHGFSVSGEDARGWHAEIFKRLYWSGSNAKFWGITWEGDKGLIDALHYQEDVANTFCVASNLYEAIGGLTDEKIVVAHSLGNMVASTAIEDYGLSVSKYFMLDAAVATECYDPVAFNDTTDGNYMVHEDWVGYNSNTWCSTWHRLFSNPDDRAKLTWKDRFSSVVPVAYNFYSSGDEIFEIKDSYPLSVFSGGLFHMERHAWQKQEVFKGCGGLGGTSWAGWGFSGEYTLAEANAASDDNLRTNAVFLHEPAEMFSSNIVTNVVNDILAQGVPALSHAVGVTNAHPDVDKNFDFNAETHKPNGWGRSGGKYEERWLHSDLKNMSYLYTYELFNQIVSKGALQ